MKLGNILVWIDLEMTGLDVDTDVILEISVIITNDQLNMVAKGPNLVLHCPDAVLNTMNKKVLAMHSCSGLIEDVKNSVISIDEAENAVLSFIKNYCAPQVAPLCGNTIYQDRIFLRKYMPKLNGFLHYHNIDVSSVKELILRWYPEEEKAFFIKKKAHRALDDIYESIEELKHYRKNFFLGKLIKNPSTLQES